MSILRISGFIFVVLGIWASLHGYVFWRLASVPWIAAHFSRRALFGVAVILVVSYPLSRFLSRGRFAWLGDPLEYFAANWIGVLFLLFAVLFMLDVLTLGGWFLPRLAPGLRGWGLIIALVLSAVALVQGLRPPVVRNYEVRIAGLPPARDGLVVVAVSDLHLGTMIGRRWLEQLVRRVNALHPDIIVVVGDLIDGNVPHVEPLVPVLKTLQAPLGVWAVTGNHEFYAGRTRSVELMEAAGFTVLQDRWAELAPGVVLAGVDDLTARRQYGQADQAIEKALANHPAGAVILLSHSPLQAGTAAAAGAGLMLSGHTHGGQIWPFGYLVKRRYPLLAGRYEVDGMPVIVSRGAGTWGPRMRLWRPGEILRIRLRAR